MRATALLATSLFTQTRSFVPKPRLAFRSTRFFASTASDQTVAGNTTNQNKNQKNQPSFDDQEVPISTIIMPPTGLKTSGDFIGLMATFDTTAAGKLVPIPEYLVPEALLEWGQAPSSLEVITSENVMDDSSSDDWIRQAVTIFPAAGCGVDNLETSKSSETIPLSNLVQTESVRALHYCNNNNNNNNAAQPNGKLRFEATFATDDDDQRVRVGVDVKENTVQSPLRVILERRFDIVSSQGTRADGGGLDGRSVSTWMGDAMKNSYKFAEQIILPPPTGTSIPSYTIPTVVLPGNVTVGSKISDNVLVLQLGHVLDHETHHVIEWTVTEDRGVSDPRIEIERL